jgi:Cu-Zn family superoxide dismutase
MRLLSILFILILVSCQSHEPSAKNIDMYNVAGDMVGTAKLTEQPEGVKVKIKVEDLSPGFHGIHIHEFPKCDAPDFKSAGNHFNPEGKKHGLMHPEGAHLGDMPNVEADESGMVDGELIIPDATLLDGNKSIVQKGTSLIIDEDMDDGVSQPSGKSGARILCGEIKPQSEKENKEAPTDPTDTKDQEEED